jgi:hypothetical protein
MIRIGLIRDESRNALDDWELVRGFAAHVDAIVL